MASPKHARPMFHPTRSTLSVGLTAVLIPLCLASPALAQEVDPTAAPVLASAPTSTVVPAAAPAPVLQSTVVTVRGPVGVVAPGLHGVAARLLAGDRPVANAYLRLEKWNGTAWVYAGRVLTRADGLGTGRLSFDRTIKLRAVYQGSATRKPGASAARTVAIASQSFRQKAVQVASQQNGKPYRWGSTGPDAFDCSGLIQYSFRRAGKSLPRTSGEMFRATQRISQSSKQVGDLIFMSSNGRIGHVGVYAGNGKFWDAPRAGRNVSLRPIWSSSYFVGRVR